LQQPPKPVLHLVERGIEVFVLPPPFARLPTRMLQKLKTKLGLNKLDPIASWLRGQKPDLVCVSNSGIIDGLEFLEKCAAHDLPFASIIQANGEGMWPMDHQAERLIDVYAKARRVFFVSEQNRRLFETQLGFDLTNAEVVRNPANVRYEASLPWPDDGQGLRLACVGRLEPNAKGQDLIFQVLATDVWKSRPVALSLYGAGTIEKSLPRLATKLGIDHCVSFIGHVADIEQVWATHHALVLTSRFEGLPISIVEAILCARPSIVTDVAGNAEMVEDGVSGFVAPAPTVRFVAEALERAWERRGDWQQMGKAARQRVESLVPKDAIGVFGQKLLDCIRESAQNE
jgi:glycosyltransferase involved in cell wall biosynthesis